MIGTLHWNVDTQYDFMRDDDSHKGTLPVPGARSIEENLSRLTRLAAKENIRVVNTADWHTSESKEFSATPDYITTFPPHCMEGTKGAQYVPATAPKNPYCIDWRDRTFDKKAAMAHREIVLRKDAFDVFTGNPHTGKLLDLLQPLQVIVYGVATNYCVQHAVQGLLEHGVPSVIVVSDAIKAIVAPDSTIPTPTGWLYGSVEEFIDKEWRAKGVTMMSTDRLMCISDMLEGLKT